MIQPLTLPEILTNVEAVASTLEQASVITPNDLEMLTKYLQDMVTLQALITDTHASVKYLLLCEKETVLNKVLKAEIEGTKKDGTVVTVKVSPSIQKIFAECRAKEYEYLYAKTDRLCANVSHAIEAVRSLISNAKQEKYFSQHGN